MATFQLDAYSRERDRYEVVKTGSDPDKLREWARTLGLTAWRIWNRTARAERDRLLPPVSAIVKTTHHGRRWSRVHLSPAKRATDYETYSG